MLRNVDEDDPFVTSVGGGGASVMTTLLSVVYSSLGAAPLLGRLDRGNAAMTR